jgi:hypothetical protein
MSHPEDAGAPNSDDERFIDSGSDSEAKATYLANTAEQELDVLRRQSHALYKKLKKNNKKKKGEKVDDSSFSDDDENSFSESSSLSSLSFSDSDSHPKKKKKKRPREPEPKNLDLSVCSLPELQRMYETLYDTRASTCWTREHMITLLQTRVEERKVKRARIAAVQAKLSILTSEDEAVLGEEFATCLKKVRETL